MFAKQYLYTVYVIYLFAKQKFQLDCSNKNYK